MNILVIPDTQVKPGVKTDHLDWASNYIRAMRPDVIVHMGDHFDMHSLSSYDQGKKAGEGARVTEDVQVGCQALDKLMGKWHNLRSYSPQLVFTKGNHEQRLQRYENDYPWLAGSLPDPVAYLARRGWEVVPFLQPKRIAGVAFSHFFPRTQRGTITASSQKSGAASAFAQIKANMVSCVAGHKQGLDSAIYNLDDRRLRGIIAGSFYLHDEPYMSCNNYWRGILHLHRVKNGDFTLNELDINYLKEHYG